MDSTNDQSSTSQLPEPDQTPRVLRRSTHHRILGGVAAGIAEYLGIDPAIVRIAFVVLAFLGGSGLLLYAAGWLLIPADSGQVIARDWMESRPQRRNAVVMVLGIVLAVIAVSNLFAAGPWWPHWNHGIGFFFALFALTLAIVLLATSGTNRTTASRLRWLLASGLVAIIALIAVATATVFSVQALSGVPLGGGIGNTEWRPTTVSQVSKHYELAVGNLTADLSGVTFKPGTIHVKATVGIGRLVVDVPPGPSVSVAAHSGLGNVEVFGHDDSGLATRTSVQSGSARAGASQAHLVLDAETGVGQVQVVRTG
jgi:phage shock protein PspC (stress-responsive transcriptional regulator)